MMEFSLSISCLLSNHVSYLGTGKPNKTGADVYFGLGES